MNELTTWQRERILQRLREGRTLRQIQSETGHRRETIARYGRLAGHLAGYAAAHPCASFRRRHAELARSLTRDRPR